MPTAEVLNLAGPGMEAKEFGARIRARRKELGLSQAELAARLRMFQTAVSKMETGEREVTVTELQRLAEALGVDAADLIRETRPPTPRRLGK